MLYFMHGLQNWSANSRSLRRWCQLWRQRLLVYIQDHTDYMHWHAVWVRQTMCIQVQQFFTCIDLTGFLLISHHVPRHPLSSRNQSRQSLPKQMWRRRLSRCLGKNRPSPAQQFRLSCYVYIYKATAAGLGGEAQPDSQMTIPGDSWLHVSAINSWGSMWNFLCWLTEI